MKDGEPLKERIWRWLTTDMAPDMNSENDEDRAIPGSIPRINRDELPSGTPSAIPPGNSDSSARQGDGSIGGSSLGIADNPVVNLEPESPKSDALIEVRSLSRASDEFSSRL